MTVLQQSLIEAYKASDYLLHVDGQTLIFRMGEHSPATAAWLAKMAITEAGFITAYNPLGERLADAVNDSLHNDLLELVIGEGLQSWMGEGIGTIEGADGELQWPAERSLLISPLSRQGAMQIGHQFSQNAVVYITATAAELIVLR